MLHEPVAVAVAAAHERGQHERVPHEMFAAVAAAHERGQQQRVLDGWLVLFVAVAHERGQQERVLHEMFAMVAAAHERGQQERVLDARALLLVVTCHKSGEQLFSGSLALCSGRHESPQVLVVHGGQLDPVCLLPAGVATGISRPRHGRPKAASPAERLRRPGSGSAGARHPQQSLGALLLEVERTGLWRPDTAYPPGEFGDLRAHAGLGEHPQPERKRRRAYVVPALDRQAQGNRLQVALVEPPVLPSGRHRGVVAGRPGPGVVIADFGKQAE